MTLKDIFSPLPWGVCRFDMISGKLIPCRAQSRLPKDAQSVITVLFPYYLGESYYEKSNVSMYAVPADYHVIAGNILKEKAEILRSLYGGYAFEVFCDNSPVPEVTAAALAGVGVIGKNGLLINESYGSFCFIGEIVTDLPLETGRQEKRPCIGCGRCIAACPGGVLGSERFDKNGCLSHISQKKKELSDTECEMLAVSGCAWGCDVCQKVCPMNRSIKTSPIREFYDTALPVYERGAPVEGRAFAWRGEGVINRNIGILAAHAPAKGKNE